MKNNYIFSENARKAITTTLMTVTTTFCVFAQAPNEHIVPADSNAATAAVYNLNNPSLMTGTITKLQNMFIWGGYKNSTYTTTGADVTTTTAQKVELHVADTGTATIFKIFPNPASSVVNIQSSVDGTYLIGLYNTAGKNVQSERLTSIRGLSTLNLNRLNIDAGTYAIRVTDISDVTKSFYTTVLIK